MKRITIFLLLLTVFVFAGCSETKTIEEVLTGNWYKSRNPENTITLQYGWGEGKTVINFALEIDLFGDDKSIRLPVIGGPFKITEITNVENDQYILTFFFDRGGFDVSYRIYTVDSGAIWFELITDRELSFIPTGSDFLWYKIAGPSVE